MRTTPDSTRTSTRLARALLIGALLSSALGCITSADVTKETDRMSQVIRDTRVQAYYCAPKDLALAEANIDFARAESVRGDTINADEHLRIAQYHTGRVFEVRGKAGCCPDRDGDGLCDNTDKCPDDPEDFDGDEDEDGCPEYDRDGDGIKDDKDRCPDQAEDKDGYRDQDGCPEPDNDEDGVLDVNDQCPNVAEDRDNFQDEDGCPDLDNDGDGILDYPVRVDQCPNEPESFNGKDDLDGCPDKEDVVVVEKPKEFKTIVITDKGIQFKKKIQFATNSAKIVGAISDQILDEAAEALKSRPDQRVRIEGHTDRRGNAKKNKKLSQDRAESVVAALVKRGVDKARLYPVGYGPERPIDPKKNKAAYEKNRRVEFNFLKPGEEP